MKSKLLPLVLVILILLNVVLIFVLIKKPYQKKKNQPEKNFLIEKLQFSEKQKEAFYVLDDNHKQKMSALSHKIKIQKDILFNSFGDENINIDSLIAITGNLEGKKELEIFNFFKSVRKICSTEQHEKFDEIIQKAIRGPKQSLHRKSEHLPPGGERMPPIPK